MRLFYNYINVLNMKYVTINMVMFLLLIGCTKEVIVTEEVIINRTIYLNNTIIINNTVPCNITESKDYYDRDYVLGLIRQLKKYEKQQDLYFNNSDCYDNLNRTETELKECEYIMCREWNSSWC